MLQDETIEALREGSGLTGDTWAAFLEHLLIPGAERELERVRAEGSESE